MTEACRHVETFTLGRCSAALCLLPPKPRVSFLLRRYDYVEVYNGGDELSPMLGKFCGKIAPSPIISSGSQLLIKFVSDYETHGAGFSVRYEVFKTGVCWFFVSVRRLVC